jgi:AraC-like DNA-binding protein
MAGVQYNVAGTGFLTVGNRAPIALTPHTLTILPPRHPLGISARAGSADCPRTDATEGAKPASFTGNVSQSAAIEGVPQLTMIGGHFRACYGASIDLFSPMECPIVERFEEGDRLESMFKAALSECAEEEVGACAMTSTLLKQVLLKLLRRSLVSADVWVERFSILGDPQLARAFSDMVGCPGASHSVHSLSRTAGLSRSIFMSRFATVFGRPPMTVLRELRMRRASLMLNTGRFSVDQVAHKMGYANRTTFVRAFQKTHGTDPADKKQLEYIQPNTVVLGA